MKNTSKPAVHFHSIDALRSLAAIAVCFFHYSYFLPKEGLLFDVLNQGYLGVDAFFVISGFVVPYSFAVKKYDISLIWSYFKKRFARIEPAYWMSIILMIFKDAIARLIIDYRYFKLPPYDPLNLIIHYFHLNDILGEPYILNVQLYWTLAIDWQFYLFVSIFFFFINQRLWWARYAFYAAYIASCWYMTVEFKAWLPFWGVLFLPGVLFYHFKMKYMGKIEFYALLAVVLWVILQKMSWNHFSAVSISCLIILLANRPWAVTSFLGKISYSLYLTHIFSGWWVISGLVLEYPDPSLVPLFLVIGVLVSILFAHFFYKLIEVPTQNWARTL